MKTQLELTFEQKTANRRATANRRRVPGAGWWFAQMHAAVDHAFDWSRPQPRPEQRYLPLASASRTTPSLA